MPPIRVRVRVGVRARARVSGARARVSGVLYLSELKIRVRLDPQ